MDKIESGSRGHRICKDTAERIKKIVSLGNVDRTVVRRLRGLAVTDAAYHEASGGFELGGGQAANPKTEKGLVRQGSR